jgi:hypothetical protein
MARADDLTRASAEDFWKRFEAVMGGSDGLMTYRYLGTQVDVEGGAREGGMRLRRDLRNPAGGLLASPLSIALADLGGVAGDAVGVPAPVMTSVHLLDAGRGVRAIRVIGGGTPGRRGKTLSFGGTALVVDADDRARVLAVTKGMSVLLAAAPKAGGYRYVDPGPGVPDVPELPPLPEAFGARRSGDGWELPELTQRIGSTSGSLHHGPTQIVLEAAAMDFAARHAGTDRLQIEDWTVMYTAPGRDGPFRTGGDALGGSLGRTVARVHLVDAGHGDRLVATALATFRRAD